MTPRRAAMRLKDDTVKEETLNTVYLLTQYNDLATEIENATDDPEYRIEMINHLENWLQECKIFSGTRKLVWEVFVDRGRTSEECLRYEHVDVWQFGLDNGWDFEDETLVDEWLQLVDKEKPDEILFAPPCYPWCSWHRVYAALRPGYKEKIQETRDKHKSTILRLVKEGYEKTTCSRKTRPCGAACRSSFVHRRRSG